MHYTQPSLEFSIYLHDISLSLLATPLLLFFSDVKPPSFGLWLRAEAWGLFRQKPDGVWVLGICNSHWGSPSTQGRFQYARLCCICCLV